MFNTYATIGALLHLQLLIATGFGVVLGARLGLNKISLERSVFIALLGLLLLVSPEFFVVALWGALENWWENALAGVAVAVYAFIPYTVGFLLFAILSFAATRVIARALARARKQRA